MPVKPMLGGIELQQVQKIETDEDQVLTQHSVPALEGDFLQGLGRRATGVTLVGVMSGADAAASLKTLRDKYRAGEVVSFVADIATATKVDQVLIEEFGVRELAGKPARFEYELTLREFIPPPPPESVDPPPPPLPTPNSVDPELGKLVVEVIIEGEPGFDFSTVTVTVEGRGADGTSLSRTMTNRTDNTWTDENMPLGQFTVRARAGDRSGLASAQIRGGQTTRATITLQSVSAVAAFFLIHFRFNKGFVEPCLRHVLREIADRAAGPGDEKILILGHTDKVDIEPYNQSLSERRARAVFAFLTFGGNRQQSIDEWDALRQPRTAPHSQPTLQDGWGTREYQHILQDLGFYPGRIDGRHGPITDEAVRAYRCHKGLPPGTQVDNEVWLALIEDYLAQDNFNVPASRFFANCGTEIVKWLGAGEEDPVKNILLPHRPSRRAEVLFVRATSLPGPVPQPDTFALTPPTTPVNSDWCIGPRQPGGNHVSFVTKHLGPNGQPQPCTATPGGPFCREPVDPGTLTLQGSIRDEAGALLTNQSFIIITPNGEFLPTEGSTGEGLAQTTATGEFRFPDKPAGFYSLEVQRDVLVRNDGDSDATIKGNTVCKELRTDTDRLNVVVVNAPIVREIKLPVVAHLMTALHPTTREIRTCPLAAGGRAQQATALTNIQVRAALDETNVIWRQARVRFTLDDADIVREFYAFRDECHIDPNEFITLIERCTVPEAINIFFVGDLAIAGEAGLSLSLEAAAAQGVNGSGCAVGDRVHGTVGPIPIDLTLNDQQRAQVTAHEFGHLLNLPDLTDNSANASRLMRENTADGSNHALTLTEVNQARASQAASDDCVPLTLNVTGATRVGSSLSNQFILVQDAAATVTVDAQIPARMLAPAVGTLTMTGGNPGASPLQRTVSGATTAVTEVVATYTPAGGNPPITARAVVQVVTFTLRAEGACLLGDAASTNFISVQSVNPNDVITVSAVIDPGLFCVPDNLVTWSGGVAAADPLRRKVGRTNLGPVPISATLAGVTRAVTLQVVAFTLRVEGATQVGPPGADTFVVGHDPTASVTVIAEINPTPAPLPPDIVTWVGGAATADPLRRRIPRTPTGEFPVRATICGVTRQVTIQVVPTVTITKTAPARPAFDEISNANEPVLTVCGTAPATLGVDATPNSAHVFYTTDPNSVVDLNPTERVGDGGVIIQPRALPAGTNRLNGRETRLSVRIVNATGPEALRNGQPARVRIRQFEQIEAHLLVHIVRDNGGKLPGSSRAVVEANFETALAEANTLWGRACITLVPRRTAAGGLDVDFIDDDTLLEVTATVINTSVTFPGNEDNAIFTHGGVNRNTANPTFINVYLINLFDGAPRLGGASGDNHSIIIRRLDGSLLAHEMGHCLGLRDLDNLAGITDLDRRLMRSDFPRGEILTSSGTVGDEINAARNRATTFTG